MGARHVVVVGAGIGGLAAATRLAAAGERVTLLEAAATPGGKLREQCCGGLAIDAGPTVFTMRWVFDELFEAAGTRLDEHLVLRRAEVLARHAWDGAQFDLHADLEAGIDAVGRFAGAGEARRYRAFCARAADVYTTLERPFLRAPRPNPVSLAWRVGFRGLPGLLRIAPFATLWTALGEHFHDARLRQLFGRYATYCGASPWQAPATLMLIAHVERDGVWHVGGGMARIADALAALAQRHGARLRCAAPVRRLLVERGRMSAVELDGGERIDADAVIFNGDPAALTAGLLGEPASAALAPMPAARRSQSAITWALRAHAQGFPLLRHNVFFGTDYAAEFDAVFRRGQLPADPTVYVCAQDRGDPEDPAPGGPERLLCLVNAPARADHQPLTREEIETCERRMQTRLARCGLTLVATHAPMRTTPADFHRLFPATGGALYGAASHGWRASFTRPAQTTRVPGLFLCGGATHPGPGLPMAALSGQLAAQAALRHLRTRAVSMSSSHPAAMPGGTSTP